MRFFPTAAVACAALLLASCATPARFVINDVTDARALSDEALALFEAGDYEGAHARLNSVIAYGSVDARDYARRAAVRGALQDYENAMKDANRSLELLPGQWRIHLQRAVFHQRLGRYEAAIGELDMAASFSPGEEELVRRRAYLKVVAGRFLEAAEDYAALARLSPASDVGPLGRGVALYLAGEWGQASAAFERLLLADPTDGLVALWLAKSSMRGGNPVAWEAFVSQRRKGNEWIMLEALLSDASAEAVQGAMTRLSHGDAEGHGKLGSCEQALFLGAWRLIRAGGDGALRDFRRAEKECPVDSIEASEARVEMARLRE